MCLRDRQQSTINLKNKYYNSSYQMQKTILICFLCAILQFSLCSKNYHLYCECLDEDIGSISTDKTYCSHWECDQKANTASCFPGSTFVLGKNGSQLRMDQLEYNTKIMTVDYESGEFIEDEVIGFLHKIQNGTQEFLRIELANNAGIDISQKHLIFGRKYGNSEPEYYFADNLEIGDDIFLQNDWEPILSIQKFNLTGIYAPLTTTGTILVNNILVSCYANLENQLASQLAFVPYKYLIKFMQLILNENEQKIVAEYDVDGIHWYANLLMKLSRVMPESLNYEIQSNLIKE
eukprot:TRINITY_DN11665_c0_g1_i4.p1 TRINITY_DN11665_c0_g1~~TRINITY_DN11665_c0_g1_i4.p1  ORF type:complete len:339 (+),score=34.54 TRINITY_DN11665_c0_g1_i4:144-1019(+)